MKSEIKFSHNCKRALKWIISFLSKVLEASNCFVMLCKNKANGKR